MTTSDYISLNRKYEQKWFPKVKKPLDKKVSSLIRIIEEDGIESGIRWLNVNIGIPELTAVVMDLYKDVGMRYARISERRLRKDIQKGWTNGMDVKQFGKAEEWIRFIENYLRMHLIEKITFRVNETLRNMLLTIMNESIEKGWGVSETVKHLEEAPLTKYQSARIVRTEVNRAANAGVKAQGDSFEYELMKEWISVQDRRTRGVDPEDHADHLRMNGQRVDFYADFADIRSGVSLSEPGDPKAPAGDTINCRCQHTTVPKRDQNGRLIPKQSRVSVILPGQINRGQVITI